MPAGRLRHYVALEKRTQAADETIGITTTFATVARTWVQIEATKGSVYAATIQVGEGPTHRIVMRYRDAAAFDFISEGTRRFSVTDARDIDGRKTWLEIMAEEQAK